MNGKYTSSTKYVAARAKRAVLRTMLRRLVSWTPLEAPQPGYTVLIACKCEIQGMLGINLRFLASQNAPNLREVLIVLDRTREAAGPELESSIRAQFPSLPLRFLYYSDRQARVADRIAWGWVYSWLSWSKGIAAARTRYVLLQDFDALLLGPNILEDRFAEIQRRGHQFLGVSFYQGNGVEPTDRLATTFELMFDAQFVRRQFKPIDLFNHITVHNGRSVDFDTLLYAQSRHGTSSVLPIDEEHMVHPSQMICQYTDLHHRRGYVPPLANNLLLIPYYIYVSGEDTLFNQHAAALRDSRGKSVEIFGRPTDCSRLTPVHAQWITKQAGRVERAVHGQVRPEVREYFEMIERLAASDPADAPARGDFAAVAS
ncbi:MAG: hypothetical protein KF745_01490 [Phycisphaeraceae bacterium]|nr:hypothetical protein [Phycisphaeraceae bacterium]